MKEIERVDQWVNAHVKPVSDMEHWGVIDQWDYPSDGKGDCEDFVLFKRKILIGEGFPRQALLMTVETDQNAWVQIGDPTAALPHLPHAA